VIVARSKGAEAQASVDGYRRQPRRGRSVAERALVVRPPAVSRPGVRERAGVDDTGSDGLCSDSERRVAEAAAALTTPVGARGHDHVLGPGAGCDWRGPHDLGATHHSAV